MSADDGDGEDVAEAGGAMEGERRDRGSFGAREGVRANTLLWWSSRLKRDAGTAASSMPVRMVQLVRVPSSSRGSGVIVDLPDARVRVMVEPGFDRETFAVVLEMLRREQRA